MSVSNIQSGDRNITLGTPNLIELYLGDSQEPLTELQINTTYDRVPLLLRVKNISPGVIHNLKYFIPSPPFRLLNPEKVPIDLNPGEEVGIQIEVDTSVSSEHDLAFGGGYLEITTGSKKK